MSKPDQTGAALPPDDDEFDYTDKQLEAIHQALRKEGLKPEAKWSRIISDIICLVSDVYGGYSQPDQVMYPGRIKRSLQPLKTNLEAALQTFNGLSQRYQRHINDQFVPLDDGKIRRCLHEILSAVQQAQERPPHEMTANLQYSGSPKNHGIRLIVEELLLIFQRVTGNEPILYASSITHDNSKYRCKGNCYAFLVACVAPTKLVARRYLGSTLLAAYRDLMNEKDPMTALMKPSKQASKARPKKKK